MSLVFNDFTVDRLLENYDVKITDVFDSESSYVAISGKNVKNKKGERRTITVKYEGMSESQVHDLFVALKRNANGIVKIQYFDPIKGVTTSNFICQDVISSRWFIDDYGRTFYTVPDMTFEEQVEEDSEESG